MNKYLYKIKDLEIPTHLKYWFARKSKVNFDLSQILNGTSFDLTNTVNKKLHLINIFGNSVQNGEPTPENTIEVKSSGDNGYIVEKFVNKNLFDIEKIIRGKVLDITTGELIAKEDMNWCTTDFINVPSKKVFTLSGEIVPQYWELRVVGYDKNKHYINGFSWGYYNKKTITFDEEVSYIRFTFYKRDYEQFIQLETGSTATDYEPHQEQVFTIPCQQPMRAIGDVKDKFVNIKGVWYERHNIGEFILNGSENWNRTETKTSGNYYFFCDNVLNNILYTNNKFAGISNIGITTSVYQEIQGVDTIYYDSKNRTRIYTEITKAMTVTEFKDWLTLNNVKIIYVLLTPIELPCTQAQITAVEAIQKARTYKNITHIYSEDEVPANLEIQYYKEKGE